MKIPRLIESLAVETVDKKILYMMMNANQPHLHEEIEEMYDDVEECIEWLKKYTDIKVSVFEYQLMMIRDNVSAYKDFD